MTTNLRKQAVACTDAMLDTVADPSVWTIRQCIEWLDANTNEGAPPQGEEEESVYYRRRLLDLLAMYLYPAPPIRPDVPTLSDCIPLATGTAPDGYFGDRRRVTLYWSPGRRCILEAHANGCHRSSILPMDFAGESEARWYIANDPRSHKYRITITHH